MILKSELGNRKSRLVKRYIEARPTANHSALLRTEFSSLNHEVEEGDKKTILKALFANDI